MSRSKPKFRCHHCKKNMGSAMASAAHFQKYPKHRTAVQLRAYKQNLALRDARNGNRLPTLKRSTGTAFKRAQKFCTRCGQSLKPAFNYCGGCGAKL